MIRLLLAAALGVLPILASGCARAQGDEQTLVDRATLTVQEIVTQQVSQDPLSMLRKARAVMICPRVFKAGFFFGGEGGACVLLARAGNGTWSYPAFYGMGGGSFGLQIGIQDSQLMMMVMTNKGLNAVMDSQFKFGADASIAIATVGASVEGATTAAAGADIVAFALNRGVFGGVALQGSIMSTRSQWNQAYYGQPFSARQVVVQMQGVNHGADPLREVLTRYGAGGAPTQAAAPYAPSPNRPGYAPAYPQGYSPQAAPAGYPQQGAQGYPQQAPANYPQQAAPAAYPQQSYAPQQLAPQQAAPSYQPPANYPPSYPPQSGGRGPIQEQSLGALTR